MFFKSKFDPTKLNEAEDASIAALIGKAKLQLNLATDSQVLKELNNLRYLLELERRISESLKRNGQINVNGRLIIEHKSETMPTATLKLVR